MPVYTINGRDLHVHEEGEGRKVAILIHGWSSSWFAMSPLLALLTARGYRCLAVDLPGYGKSPKLPERVTISAYRELIAGLIREVSEKPVVLIGHSMGGMTSITLAKAHPELVERMVLLCPTISGNLSTRINITLGPFVLLERSPITNALVTALEPLMPVTDRLLRPALFAHRTRIKEEDYERIKADTRRRDQGRIRAECFWAMRDNDLRGKIGDIKTPTLIIWGMEDNTVPLRDASLVAEEWPDADLRIIPNAGHWPHFEAPKVTEQYIRGFLSKPLKLLSFFDESDDEGFLS
jgi:pimeloyl-ACP methyl ester carboxylesterase